MGSSGGRRRRSREATCAMALGSEQRFSQEKTCCQSSVDGPGPPWGWGLGGWVGMGGLGWVGMVGSQKTEMWWGGLPCARLGFIGCFVGVARLGPRTSGAKLVSNGLDGSVVKERDVWASWTWDGGKITKNGGLATKDAQQRVRSFGELRAFHSCALTLASHPFAVFQVDRIGYKPSCDERLIQSASTLRFFHPWRSLWGS